MGRKLMQAIGVRVAQFFGIDGLKPTPGGVASKAMPADSTVPTGAPSRAPPAAAPETPPAVRGYPWTATMGGQALIMDTRLIKTIVLDLTGIIGEAPAGTLEYDATGGLVYVLRTKGGHELGKLLVTQRMLDSLAEGRVKLVIN